MIGVGWFQDVGVEARFVCVSVILHASLPG